MIAGVNKSWVSHRMVWVGVINPTPHSEQGHPQLHPMLRAHPWLCPAVCRMGHCLLPAMLCSALQPSAHRTCSIHPALISPPLALISPCPITTVRGASQAWNHSTPLSPGPPANLLRVPPTHHPCHGWRYWRAKRWKVNQKGTLTDRISLSPGQN